MKQDRIDTASTLQVISTLLDSRMPSPHINQEL